MCVSSTLPTLKVKWNIRSLIQFLPLSCYLWSANITILLTRHTICGLCYIVWHLYFFLFCKYLFSHFHFWLHWIFIAVCRLLLVVESGGSSLLQCTGFSMQWLLLWCFSLPWQSKDSRVGGLQQLWLPGSRARAE